MSDDWVREGLHREARRRGLLPSELVARICGDWLRALPHPEREVAVCHEPGCRVSAFGAGRFCVGHVPKPTCPVDGCGNVPWTADGLCLQHRSKREAS